MTDQRHIWAIECLDRGEWVFWNFSITKRDALAAARDFRRSGGKWRVVKYVPEKK